MQHSRSIHVNPRFKLAHINPSFLSFKQKYDEIPTTKTRIFINPNFIEQSKSEQKQSSTHEAPIITKTRRKIVRQTTTPKISEKPVANLLFLNETEITSKHSISNDLIKVGQNKLIRIKGDNSHVKTHVTKLNKYKFVRGTTSEHRRNVVDTRRSIIKKYFICRDLKENSRPTSVVENKKILLRMKSFITYRNNKSLEFLNINGVRYKSTANKLEKKSSGIAPRALQLKSMKLNGLLIVRGDKFFMEPNGKSLKRICCGTQTTKSSNEYKRKRIDIGGLTYIAKNGSTTFEQTQYHTSRTHITLAKSKSIHLLTRRYSKLNVPCTIYRRLGKCLAFESGRCPKIHDRKRVMICPKHLKGECLNDKCLLSHDINLSKMPTCKFFLQGCCIKANCPYLHKKLNEDVEVCEEFLKGFCLFADRCSKRHEVTKLSKIKSDQICPWFEKHGACLDKNCQYLHTRILAKISERTNTKKSSKLIGNSPLSTENNTRYFKGTIENSQMNHGVIQDNKCDAVFNTNKKMTISSKPTTLNNLPSYIPL